MTNAPAPGIYAGITNDAYHSGPGVSSSQLKKLIDKSPAHLKAQLDEPEEITPQLQARFNIGTAIHTGSLEPHLFESSVAIAPDNIGSRSTKAYKTWAAEHTGKLLLTHKAGKTATRASQAIHDLPFWPNWLKTGMVEHSVYWEEQGQLFKARPDLWRHRALVDIKSAEDASPAAFARSCANLHYPLSLAMYEDGLRQHGHDIDAWVYVVVETGSHPAIQVYVASENFKRIGREEYELAKRTYLLCYEDDSWPSYDPAPQILDLPRWAR